MPCLRRSQFRRNDARPRFSNLSRPVTPDVFVDACSKSRRKLVEACLKVGQDPDTITQNGYTARNAAAANNDVDLLRLLLARGADIKSHLSGTALETASGRASADSFKLLLDAGARIDLGTPLFAAANGQWPHEIRTRSSMVRALLDAGCEPNRATAEGRTPLMATIRGAGRFNSRHPFPRVWIQPLESASSTRPRPVSLIRLNCRSPRESLMTTVAAAR